MRKTTKTKTKTATEARKSKALADARRERKNERRREARSEARKTKAAPRTRTKTPAKRVSTKKQSRRAVAKAPVVRARATGPGPELADDAPLLPEVEGERLHQFDTNVGQYVRQQVAAAITSLCETNGLRAEVCPAEVEREYGDTMKVALVFRIPQYDSRGRELPYRETSWLRYAHTLGLKTEWLGRKVLLGSVVYAIAGLDLKRKEKPVLLAHGGKLYFDSVESVTRAITG